MACDTFIKIAKSCRRHFVAHQPGETEAFIDEIVRNLRRITVDLNPQQVHTFYEACGYMISAQGQKSIQERLIQDLMAFPNQAVSIVPFWSCSVLISVVGIHHRCMQQGSKYFAGSSAYQNHWKYHED